MNRRMTLSGAIAGMVLVIAGFALHSDETLGQAKSPPSTPTPRPSTPPPPPPPAPPRTPTYRADPPVRTDPAYVRQLEQAAVRRKMQLEEASARADELVKVATRMSAEIAKTDARDNYKELGAQLVRMGTDMQVMVARIRASYEDPVIQDVQLKSDSDRLVAMDNLLAALIRALREAERMSDPIAVLATP